MTNEAYKHLFESAISVLAAIDRELGLPDDGCNATALTIAEIQRLKKLAAISNAAAKAETAAAVAKERERAATVVDEKIGSVCKANPGRGGRINSAVAFALDALRDCAGAISAGAPPDTLREAGAVAGGAA